MASASASPRSPFVADSAADGELAALRRELLIERERSAQLEARLESERGARAAGRALERDYDEIITLLEAEVAHLRAQLAFGPDEKDRQLLNYRQRCTVLGCQLNKAVVAKQGADVALRRLLDLARATVSRRARLRNARKAPGRAWRFGPTVCSGPGRRTARRRRPQPGL